MNKTTKLREILQRVSNGESLSYSDSTTIDWDALEASDAVKRDLGIALNHWINDEDIRINDKRYEDRQRNYILWLAGKVLGSA